MNKYYKENAKFLCKGVVLCQPGLFCEEGTFDPMWNKLRTIADSTTIALNDKVLMASNITTYSVKNILKNQAKIQKVCFFKTLFSNPIGRIDEQAEELNTIIQGIKDEFGEDIPLYLIGYSKGGLVNMRYVTIHPGVVKNVISIGTPYLNSFIQKVLSISDDIFGAPLYFTPNNNTAINQLIKFIRDYLDAYVSDEDLGSDSFFEKLHKEWNDLPANKKPYYTCIACSQVGFTSNPEDGCDMVVSVEAQKAKGLKDINDRITISDNYEYIIRENWLDYLYMVSPLMKNEAINNIENALALLLQNDTVGALYSLVLSVVPYTWDISKYDLLHTRELGNENVCKAVLAALNKTNNNKGAY